MTDPMPTKKMTTTGPSRQKRILVLLVAPNVAPAKATAAIPARTAKAMDSQTSCGHDHLLSLRLRITHKLLGRLQCPLHVRLLGMMPREFNKVGFLQECTE